MKKIFWVISLVWIFAYGNASTRLYDFASDGVFYEILSMTEKTVAVVGFDYDVPDDCIIPSHIEYESQTYTVTEMNQSKLPFEDDDPEHYILDSYGDSGPVPLRLTIPGTVKKISDEIIFYYGASLQELIIEEGDLEEIGVHAFGYCRNLSKVRLPSNLKRIKSGAFDMDLKINEINIPDSLEEVGKYAFGQSHCMDWALRTFPSNESDTRTIHDEYKTLILPNSLIKIGEHAFDRECWNLYSSDKGWNNVILPSNIKYIEDYTFKFNSLPEIIIPNLVKSIGRKSFHPGHYEFGRYIPGDLEKITMGMSVKIVDEYAFGDAPYLKEFYCLPPTPPLFVFADFNPEATVLVPPGSIDAYRKAEGWNHFTNFQELPNVLIQFQIHSYSLTSNKSAELRYIVSNLGNVEITSQEWTATRPDGSDATGALIVENGFVKGLQSGDYYLTLTLTDTQGEKYSAKCVVLVDSDGSGIDQIFPDSTLSKDGTSRIFNLQGVCVGESTENLPSGIYVIQAHGKSQKIRIK